MPESHILKKRRMRSDTIKGFILANDFQMLLNYETISSTKCYKVVLKNKKISNPI